MRLEKSLPSEYHKYVLHFPNNDIVRITFPEHTAPSYGAIFNLEDEFYECHGVVYQIDPHTEEYRVNLFFHVLDVKEKRYLLEGPERHQEKSEELFRRIALEDELQRIQIALKDAVELMEDQLEKEENDGKYNGEENPESEGFPPDKE